MRRGNDCAGEMKGSFKMRSLYWLAWRIWGKPW